MIIDFETLSARDIYQTMIRSIVPRPIAWVLSDNGNETFNLAPFSYFNGVSSKPPIISISIGLKRDGSKKDTWRNIEERSHFVAHIAHTAMAAQMSATAASLDFGDSEVTANDIELVDAPGFDLPRIKESRIAFSCRLHRIIEVGEGPQALILGEIQRAFIDDSVTGDTNNAVPSISAKALDPLARLGGDDYSSLNDVFTVQRPN